MGIRARKRSPAQKGPGRPGAPGAAEFVFCVFLLVVRMPSGCPPKTALSMKTVFPTRMALKKCPAEKGPGRPGAPGAGHDSRPFCFSGLSYDTERKPSVPDLSAVERQVAFQGYRTRLVHMEPPGGYGPSATQALWYDTGENRVPETLYCRTSWCYPLVIYDKTKTDSRRHKGLHVHQSRTCLLYTSPSPRD